MSETKETGEKDVGVFRKGGLLKLVGVEKGRGLPSFLKDVQEDPTVGEGVDFHVGDLPLFWLDVRRNVAVRARAWRERYGDCWREAKAGGQGATEVVGRAEEGQASPEQIELKSS